MPAARALRQRPGIPGARSTFGTSTELLNVVRLMFSRLASHVCPNGHRQEPTLNVAAEEPFACPTCGPNAKAQGAEELAFNSVGTCPSCEGSGIVREPSIGLRPSNIRGLQGVIAELLEEGNSVVMVDHDPLVLRDSDHLIEIGPGSGNDGGTVVATGTVGSLGENPDPLIGGFLTGRQEARACTPAAASHVFDQGGHQAARLPNHTVHTFDITIPRGRITAVTGVPASGMSTLVLDSLLPALRATDQARLPSHVTSIDTAGIEKAGVVDATPIGANVRSTVATYSGILDELRRAYAKLDSAKAAGLSARDFSYNTDSLRCPRCEGTGEITLDVQFLPDVDIACPDGGAAVTVPTQTATLFVFDEPTIGLHPLDVRVLIGVLQRLVDQGGTVVVIEHDLDVIANSDHVIDMGPDGGVDGGRIVVAGTPNQVADAKDSVTGQYLAKEASP